MAALPLEIITEILCKLPPKPLLCFKCVSKSWNSLISSPNFIKRHLSQTLISDTNPKIVVSNNSLFSAALSDTLRFSAIDHPLNRPAVDLIESRDGILLISDTKKKSLFLLNPSTKTQRLIPRAPSNAPKSNDDNLFTEALGFGYDGCSDDYKVVRLLQWCNSVNLGFCGEVAVYSVRKNSWNLIENGGKMLSSTYYIQPTNTVFAKEMLHFIAKDGSYKPVLMCFDLRIDAMSIVEYPEMEFHDPCKMTTSSLRELNGCFCMLLSHQRHKVDPRKAVVGPLYNRRFLYADVWEMRERGRKESWVKLFTIRKSEIGVDCMYLRLVTYSKDKGSVLVVVDGTWFGWYDLAGKRVRRVSVEGLRDEDSPHVAFMMVESLVSLANDKNHKAVSKVETTTKKAIKKYSLLLNYVSFCMSLIDCFSYTIP